MFGLAGSLKRNVAMSWLAHAVTVVIGIFLMPYVVRVLGDHQYGTWVFVNSVAGYSGLLYLGFGETISRFVANYESEGEYRRINAITSMVLSIYVGMGLVGLAVAGVAALFLNSLGTWEPAQLLEIRLVILVLGLNILVGLAGSVFGGVLIGLRRFDMERGISLASDLIRLLLIVVFLQREWGLLTIALIYLGITLAENGVYAWLAFRALPSLRIDLSLVNWDTFKSCGQFSAMAFLNTIAAQMIYATDTIVIGLMMGTDAITPYYIAMRLVQFIRQPIEKIAHICMPTAGALQRGVDRAKRENMLCQAFGVTFLLAGGLFIGGWYFGGDVIRLWMGNSYGISHHVFVILMAAEIVALPCGILRAFLFGQGQVRLPALIYLMEAIANLGLSLLLCGPFGILGVAWGTTIPLIGFELFLLVPYSLRLLGVQPQVIWRRAIYPQLLPFALLWCYCVQIESQGLHAANWLVLLAITAAGGGLLIGSWAGTRRLLATA